MYYVYSKSFRQRLKPFKNYMGKIKTNIKNTNNKTPTNYAFIWKYILFNNMSTYLITIYNYLILFRIVI